MNQQVRHLGVCAAALLAVTGLVACSSSSTGTTNQSAPRTTSAAVPSAGGGSSLNQAVAIFSKYTGGTSGSAASGKSPITIGFENDEGGIPSFPEGTVAAQAAVDLINKRLGGVNGHPLILNTCFVSSGESQGQACAEQFQAKKVPVIVESNGSVGGASLHTTLSGRIPVIMPNPDSVLEATAPGSFGTNAAVFGTDTGFLTYAATNHAKTASLLFPGDDPVGQTAAKQLEGYLGKIGVKVTPAGFASTSPDLLPALVASGASRTDMTIMLTVTPSSCIAGAKALKQAHIVKPTIGLFLCISPQVKQGLGDYPAWTYVDAGTNVDNATDPATQAYLATMKSYAPADANVGGNAQFSFSAILNAARALGQAGDGATPAKVAAVLKSDTVAEPMMDPAVKYGSIQGLPNLPNLGVRLFTYHGSGRWTDLTHGKWVAPPA